MPFQNTGQGLLGGGNAPPSINHKCSNRCHRRSRSAAVLFRSLGVANISSFLLPGWGGMGWGGVGGRQDAACGRLKAVQWHRSRAAFHKFKSCCFPSVLHRPSSPPAPRPLNIRCLKCGGWGERGGGGGESTEVHSNMCKGCCAESSGKVQTTESRFFLPYIFAPQP